MEISPVAATLGQPLVVKYEMYGRENVSFVDQGAATRNTIVRSKNRAICHKAGDTRMGKGALPPWNFESFKSPFIVT
jgi:hypothetical protein